MGANTRVYANIVLLDDMLRFTIAIQLAHPVMNCLPSVRISTLSIAKALRAEQTRRFMTPLALLLTFDSASK